MLPSREPMDIRAACIRHRNRRSGLSRTRLQFLELKLHLVEQFAAALRGGAALAWLHRAGELTYVWVPNELHEALRDLVRARHAACKDVRRDRIRIQGFLSVTTCGLKARGIANGPPAVLWNCSEMVVGQRTFSKISRRRHRHNRPGATTWPTGSSRSTSHFFAFGSMRVHPLLGTLPSPEACDQSRLRARKCHLDAERVGGQ